ncbi:MAG TPA: TolC family outer membrane protein [Allosphingosinicella sp.]|nr:TolC family outer membrane protein [Allosphingosinicella sp.]
MRGGLLAAAATSALLIAGAAEADTLREALVRTYNSNPTITGQRAQVRTLDEAVAIARAAGRPQLSGNVGVNQDIVTVGQGNNGRNFSAGIDVSYPLFTGGRVRNSIRAADERVLAGRALLRATEGDIFTEAVGAYMDVIRDRSIVTLNRNQVRVLETNLQASRDRFEVGDLTRTDVAQSEARLALARSNLELAEGRLVSSEENYRRVVGTMPDELQPPPPLPPLPATADQAVDIALANNQDLVSIAAQVRAAGLDVRVARADRLPTLSAVSSGRYANFLGRADEAADVAEGTLPNSTTNLGVGVQATIPIYQGGLVGARVRQAQAFQSQLLEQGIEIERAVVAQTRAAFASYQASVQAIASNEIAVAANQLALEGVRAEQTVGTRNVLDVLNAEQELLNSQVALVTARRDAYVAGFALLNAMGQAEVEDLNLDGGYLYDPVANYKRVSRRASDWSDDPAPQPVATRTVVVGPPAPGTAAPPANSPVTEPPR